MHDYKVFKQQIRHMVKQKYPVTDREKKCATERFFKNKMREEAEKKIINHFTETGELPESI
jgi:hypothetical protein